MGFLIKLIFVLLFVAVAGGFLVSKMPSWKQRVIEVVNPSAKEAKLLGELKVNLDQLDDDIDSSVGSASDREQQANKRRNLIAKSKKLVNEIASSNQNNSGIIKQGIGKIIESLIDLTPYPADHLQPPIASSVPALSCTPNKQTISPPYP